MWPSWSIYSITSCSNLFIIHELENERTINDLFSEISSDCSDCRRCCFSILNWEPTRSLGVNTEGLTAPLKRTTWKFCSLTGPLFTRWLYLKKHFISQNPLVFPGWRNVVVLPYFQLSLHLPLSCVAVFDTTKRNTLLRNCDENLHRLKAKLNILGTFS